MAQHNVTKAKAIHQERQAMRNEARDRCHATSSKHQQGVPRHEAARTLTE